ncbi:hypothetical protein Tco_1373805 [Tanacetum coccineum]
MTPVIKSTITKSLKVVVLAKSSSQPQSTYEAATSLKEFEIKKILIDKMEKRSIPGTGKTVSLKSGLEDKDKDEDPPTGSDQGMIRRKTSKDVESTKGSKSKESKSTSSSKGTTRFQPKSYDKSAKADEAIHIVDDTKVQQKQGQDMGNTDDQPNVKAASKYDWFKKPERPSTPDSD